MGPGPFLLAFLSVTLLGTGAGVLTGLSPGLHVNNVAAFVLATQGAWAGFLSTFASPANGGELGLLLSVFVLATAASHAVCDFVPSVFFGAPTEDTALAVLPGHRLLLRGEGVRAVGLAAQGALLGLLLGACLLLPLRLVLADPVGLADAFRPWSAFFLLAILAALVLMDVGHGRRRGRRLVRIICVEGVAGLLGVAALRGASPFDSATVLFPLFSGLFGVPNLLVSLRAGPSDLPPQSRRIRLTLRLKDIGPAARGALAGAAVSWLPGLSGGAASALASIGSRRTMTPARFMVVLGATSTSTAVLSVAVLFIIGRARSGAAAAVRDLLSSAGPWASAVQAPDPLLWLLLAAAMATAASAVIAVRIARRLAPAWSRVGPRRLALVTLAALFALLLLATGWAGVALAGLSAAVGLLPIRLGVRRVHLMAALLVPVHLSYLAPAP